LIIAGHDFISFINLFFIPLLIHVPPPMLQAAFRWKRKVEQMYQHKPFSKRLDRPIRRCITLHKVMLVFYIFARIQACSCASFLFLLFFTFVLVCHGAQEYHQGFAEYPWKWRSVAVVYLE